MHAPSASSGVLIMRGTDRIPCVTPGRYMLARFVPFLQYACGSASRRTIEPMCWLEHCAGWVRVGCKLDWKSRVRSQKFPPKTLPHKRRRVRDREQGWWTAMCAPVREYPIRGDLQPAKKLSRSTYSPKKLASSLPKVIRSTTALLHIINVS
jgi:hypothetical protein